MNTGIVRLVSLTNLVYKTKHR